MIAILCTDGQMKLDEVRNECVPGKWVPLFVFRVNPSDPPTVPIFQEEKTARQFIKRNLPKGWMHGGAELTDRDIQWMKDKGWILREMDYPHLVKDYLIGLEILEFGDQPDFKVS